jgi:SAM-dependent methyltransferase
MQNVSGRYIGENGEKYVTHYFDEGYHLGFLLQSQLISDFVGNDDTVLDFGCGNGGILNIFKNRCHEIIGFEVNLAAVVKARDLGINNKIISNYEDLPSNYFTLIYSNHVLEHVLNPLYTLKRINEALVETGKLVLILPIDDYRAKGQRQYSEKDIDGHFYTWTPRIISNLLREANFDVLSIRILTTAWSPRLFPLYRVPKLGYFFRFLTSIYLRRRQLRVIAKKKLVR